MTPVDLRPVSELRPHVEQLLERLLPQLHALLPDAELCHIGATALPRGVTKGDVDILARVAPEHFAAAVAALRTHFGVKQPDNWTAAFASFGDDVGYALPVGIQLVIKDSRDDFLLFLHQYLLSHPDTLEEYTRLKQTHASEGAESYWQAKDAFLGKVLASRHEASAEAAPAPDRGGASD
jgi:GrpB-like predicted nucleotidyltransferase (UPF0157 family)